jgi:8-oxo-dGTP diphosphatase
MPYTYEYPRPALTVDCVVFGLDDESLKVLLVQRRRPPFAGKWALPGGFVEMDETLEAAARRELREETGLEHIYLEQLYTFGDLDRDPRERTVSVAYHALVKLSGHRVQASSDARRTAWFPVADVPPLAFDHNRILEVACQRLRGKVRYQPIGFELLPAKFTLRQLQHLYETILGRRLDKRNFRKKILSLGILEELNEVEAGVPHRAARLFRFNRSKYDRLVKQGVDFEL